MNKDFGNMEFSLPMLPCPGVSIRVLLIIVQSIISMPMELPVLFLSSSVLFKPPSVIMSPFDQMFASSLLIRSVRLLPILRKISLLRRLLICKSTIRLAILFLGLLLVMRMIAGTRSSAIFLLLILAKPVLLSELASVPTSYWLIRFK